MYAMCTVKKYCMTVYRQARKTQTYYTTPDDSLLCVQLKQITISCVNGIFIFGILIGWTLVKCAILEG